MFCKNAVLKQITKFTGKHLCLSVFFYKKYKTILGKVGPICLFAFSFIFKLLYLKSAVLSVAYLTVTNLARIVM